MADDGYTLVEMLAAMAIVGLAMAGLAEAMQAIRLTQARAAVAMADQQTLARARRGLDKVLAGQGPFRSDDIAGLKGVGGAFEFDCRGGGKCGARLTSAGSDARLDLRGEAGFNDTVLLRGAGGARFTFTDAGAVRAAWPPMAVQRLERLAAVAIVAGADASASPLALATVRRQQPFVCAFDTVAGDCARAAP